MKDKSKRLTVVNTDKKKADENASHILQQKPASALNAAGFNPALYLLKSVWDSVFEIKTDVSGQKYLFGKLPMVTQYGVTMYGDNDELNVSDIYEGLPIDNVTLYWDNGVLKAKGGEGGGGGVADSIAWANVYGKPSWVTDTKPIYNYSEINGTPDLSVFVTGTALSNTLADYATLTYLTGELKKYVTIKDDQDIVGVKNFLNGIKISNMPIRKLQDDVIYIDANLVVRGGVTMYSDNEVDIPSIKDEIGFAGYNGSVGLASFDSSQFVISANGTVSVKGGSTGLDTAQLKEYLDSNKYTTETWVKAQGYASASSLSSLQTKVDNFLEGSDTDTIINKWKELEVFLSGLSESDNLATILSTKWTTDNNLINQWNTAYGWGDHSKVGYALKSYVDNTFVTIKGNEDVTGVHDFVNGLKIGNIKLSKSQEDVVYLEGNLVVKGGVTMYALDEVTVDSIIDSLPLASTSQYGIAKFNPSNFVINEDGFVTIIGGSGGLDTEELAEYLATNKYATQGWVEGKGYITSSALNGYATQSWVTNQKYITGITSAMVVSALGFTPYNSANFTKTNIKSTLGISDWALASSKPSYTTSEVTEGSRLYFTNQRAIDALASTLANYVTLGTKQTITGEKNFTGGLRVNNSPSIYYDATNKYWKLEGDLLVTGGVTMYGTDEGDLPSILDSLPIASTSSAGIASFDSTYFSVNASGKVTLTSAPSSVSILGNLQDVSSSVSGTTNSDVVLFKSANTSTWTTKLLSEIGGGGSIQRPLRWTGYDSGTWDGTSDGLIVIPTSLKNPNAITFTGAVSATYDGSSAVTVKIPTVDLSGYLPLSGGTLNSGGTTPFAIRGTNAYALLDFQKNTGDMVVELGWIYETNNRGNLAFLGNNSSAGIISVNGNGCYYSNDWNTLNKNTILHSGNYSSYALPLSGGTLDGKDNILSLKSSSNNGWIYFKSSSVSKASVGYFNGMACLANEAGDSPRLGVTDAGIPQFWSNPSGTSKFTLLHTGNYSSYALPLSGGTLTGSITFPASQYNLNGVFGINLNNSDIVGANSIYFQDPANTNNEGLQFVRSDGNYDVVRAYDGVLMFATNQSLGGDGASYNTVWHSGNLTSLKNPYALSWSGYSSGSYDGSSAKSITIPSNTNQLTNGAGFITSSASITGNAGSATKLQTARTIWGQSFNGTGDISGTLYLNNNVSISGYVNNVAYDIFRINENNHLLVGYGHAPNGNTSIYGNNVYLRNGANREYALTALANGNVGIGTTSPSQKLHVSGNILTTGGITMYSDIRKKTKLQDVELSLSQIANAPLIQHYYNSDQDKTTHVGSIAQYWAGLNDWFCKLDAEGFYTMEIQNCALASAISIARHLEKYESKTDKTIRKMKKRIQELEDEVERLKNN